MSLRSEYAYDHVYDPETEDYEVIVFMKGKAVDCDSTRYEIDVEDVANRMISAHMEKVTRILEGCPIDPDKAEEADRLAHKADHDNQCERDLE